MSSIDEGALGLAVLGMAVGATAVALGATAFGAAGLGDVEATLEQAARTTTNDAIAGIRKRFMDCFLRGLGVVYRDGPGASVDVCSI
jgi:hypothetical protein